ncbi:MAG: acyl-CoA synthetase [Burkholderiaceae bacterium]
MERTIWSHTLGDLLRRSAQRHPDKTAIVCGDVTWTYREFDQICNRFAAGLASLGVGVDDKVAILSRNSHAFAAARFAIARLGAVLVPVNFMLKAPEIAHILRHSGATMLLVDSELTPVGREAAAADTKIRQLVWLPSEGPTDKPDGLPGFDELLHDARNAPSPVLDARMLAQIVYTSGTESLPKGAMLTHEAIIAEYVSVVVDGEIRGEDRILHALPLFHCAQLDVYLGPAVYVGAVSVITAKPTPDNLLGLIERYQINSFFCPPTVWISLLRSPLFDATDLSTLNKGYYGASIMPVEVLRELLQRRPSLRLWNFYGQTEIAPLATVLKPEDQLRKAGSAGRQTLNVETRVVDDDGRDVAIGQVGEIVHRSPQLLQGYLNDPERTAQAFEGGWFHSGDLGVLDDEGYLTVVDRKKDMIKTGGENVASREVEEMIYQIPAVSEVAVIGLPDPKWIEAVTAVIVVKEGQQLSEQQVIDFCGARMGGFKVPKRVILTDALPKNPSGKLLKRDLRIKYAG